MQNSPEESFELIHEIDASPELVFQFFTDAELLERWHGVHAETEPRPGGRFMLNITGQTVTRGIFLELDPGRHLVFRAGSASAADYGRGNVHPAGARGCGCVISALQPRSPATTISAVGATICRGSPWPPAAPTRVWTHGARLPPRLGQSRCREAGVRSFDERLARCVRARFYRLGTDGRHAEYGRDGRWSKPNKKGRRL